MVEACPECGDDAQLASAPGPGEPLDEYDCPSCGHQFRLSERESDVSYPKSLSAETAE